MIKLSDFIKNNRLDYILERKNFVQDEELKKKYSEEGEPSGLMLDENSRRFLDSDEKCLGFYEYLELKKKK